MRRATDELVVELDVARDPAFERGVDRAVLAEPRAVALLEPQRHQRTHPEQAQPVRPTGLDDPVEQRALVLWRDPQLVPEVAGVVDPGQVRRVHPEIDLAEGHERERRGREVEVGGHGGEDVARQRSGHDSPTSPRPRTSKRHGPVAREVVAEPARVVGLGGQRSEQVELVGLGGSRHGELADDPALVVEHRRQRDPPGRRHPGGQQGRQPRLRARPGDPVLRVVRDLRHPDPLADGGDLLGDALPGIRAAEGDLLPRLEAGLLEPERVLEAGGRAPDRVRRGEPVVDRGRQERPPGRELLVGERDPEAPPVVLLDLGVRVGEGRVVAVPGDIHRPDVHPGVAVIAGGHPGRQGEADAAALRQPGHHAARDPVAPQAPNRPDERVAVRREREGTVDDLPQAGVAHRRVVLERDVELGRDPVEVGLEELGPEVPRRLPRAPRDRRLLVGAQEHPAALLADVDLAGEVERHRHLLAGLRDVRGDLGHVDGEQVHVLHGEDRQLDADHPADLAGPQSAGVDHVLGVDRIAVLDRGRPRCRRGAGSGP